MHVDPLHYHNESIYPAMLCRVHFKMLSQQKMSLCILSRTQQYLSESQTFCPLDENTGPLITAQPEEANHVFFLIGG